MNVRLIKKAGNNREFYVIVVIFIILVLIKLFLALSMQCPSIIGDETVYAGHAKEFAENISFESIFDMSNPPFYSVILSIAYSLGDPTGANYYFQLVINAFLAALIIFPAFFLLRDYCSYNIALCGAVLLCVIPPVFNWGFYIMTETLFTTLLVYSCYTIHKMFREGKIQWAGLAILTLLLLTGTKAVGIFLLPVACISAISFVILSRKYSFYAQIKKTQFFFIACISLIICVVVGTLLLNQNISAYSQYNTGGYLSNLISILSAPDLLFTFIILLIRECQILILLTYLVLFICALLLLFTLIQTIFLKENATKKHFSRFFTQSTMKDPVRLPALLCVVIYIILTMVIYLILVTDHMIFVPMWQYVGQADQFQVFSRYLDPIVPGILIIGIIGMSILNLSARFTKTIYLFVSVFILTIPLFFLNFPFLGYRMGDTLSVFSYSWLSMIFQSQFAGFLIVILLFAASTLIFLYGVRESKKRYFLVFLVAVSLILSGYTYTLQVNSSQNAAIGWGGACGKSLAEHIEDNAQIYVFYANKGDSAEISKYILPFYLQRPVRELTKEQMMSENITSPVKESGVPSYLISDVPVINNQSQSVAGYPGFILQLSP